MKYLKKNVKRPELRRACCIPGCKNTNELNVDGGILYTGKYVHFPTNQARRSKWVKSLNLPFTPNNSHFVCGEHFTDDAWNKQDVLLNIPVHQRKLKNGAVPVLCATTNKTNSDAEEAVYSLDVDTRKRLVAEALASYEERFVFSTDFYIENILRKVNSFNKDTHDTARTQLQVKVKRNHQKAQSMSSRSSSVGSTLEFMLKDGDSQSDTAGSKDNIEEETVHISYRSDLEDCYDEKYEIDDNNGNKIEFEILDENAVQREYKKFGEIMLDTDDLSYAFHCSFCEDMFFEILEFKSHILESHQTLVNMWKQEKKDEEINEVLTIKNGEDLIENIELKHKHNINESDEGVHMKSEIFSNNIKEERQVQLLDPKMSEEPEPEQEFEMDTKNLLENEDENLSDCPETELLFIEESDQQFFIEEENNDEKNITETEMIELVISVWKKHNVLWDKTHPDYNKTRIQKKAIETMFNDIKSIAPLKSFVLESLKSLLSELARAYREDLHTYRHLNKEHKKNFKPKYWFFYKLTFLNDKFSYLRNVEDEIKTANHLPVDISTAQKELVLWEIIELYEDAKALWHVTHPDYQGKLNNQTALKELFGKLKEKGIHVYLRSESELGELLKSLTRWFGAVEFLKQTATFESKNETKTAASNFNCTYPAVYEALAFLQNHVAPFKCSICHHVYFSEFLFLKHIRSGKNNCITVLKGGAHTCEFCQKRFKTVSDLRCHVRQHTNERPYECKVCYKRFRNYATWYRHKRTHTTVKPHKCSYCNTSYHCKNLLEAHIKTHLDIRDHVCDICGKSFTWSRYLNRHRITHMTERKHPCPECGNRFKSRDLLNSHLKRCRLKRLKAQEDAAELQSDLDTRSLMSIDDEVNSESNVSSSMNIKSVRNKNKVYNENSNSNNTLYEQQSDYEEIESEIMNGIF